MLQVNVLEGSVDEKRAQFTTCKNVKVVVNQADACIVHGDRMHIETRTLFQLSLAMLSFLLSSLVKVKALSHNKFQSVACRLCM